MAKLKCDACTCIHNNDFYCCAESIRVGGSKATEKSATRCDTFDEKSGALSSSVETPNPHMIISCKATNCVFNGNKICDASEVSICGDHADDSRETQCSTFACE